MRGEIEPPKWLFTPWFLAKLFCTSFAHIMAMDNVINVSLNVIHNDKL